MDSLYNNYFNTNDSPLYCLQLCLFFKMAVYFVCLVVIDCGCVKYQICNKM